MTTDSRFIMWRIMWYSSVIPLPPSMSRAVRAMFSAFMHELRFTIDTYIKRDRERERERERERRKKKKQEEEVRSKKKL